jgi:putative phosphoesterase
MRLAVLSDIHGNLPALQAVLDDLEQDLPDGFILAGDYTGCPQTVETIQLLRGLKGWMIQGNGEASLRRLDSGAAPAGWKTLRQFGLLRWDYARLTDVLTEFLFKLPEQQIIVIGSAPPIRVVHGSPRSPYEKMAPNGDPSSWEQMIKGTSEAVMICGHTHIPWKKMHHGQLIFNPGAVCGPLDGSVGAQYAILGWDGHTWHAEHHRVSYDLEVVRRSFRDSGLLEAGSYLARCFLLSIESGMNVADQFLTYAYQLKHQAQVHCTEFIPDDIWEHAGRTFDWDGAAIGISR